MSAYLTDRTFLTKLLLRTIADEVWQVFILSIQLSMTINWSITIRGSWAQKHISTYIQVSAESQCSVITVSISYRWKLWWNLFKISENTDTK